MLTGKKLMNAIVNWHTRTFPDCTKAEQLLKLDEELREVCDFMRENKKPQAYEELADSYIAAVALAVRFDSTIGKYFVSLIEERPSPKLIEEVNQKLAINKKRKWHKVDGVYRHVD